MHTIRPTILPKMLTALLLAAGAATISGCVAYDGYDPYYPAYGGPVVAAPPTVYAVPPPVIVQPGYRYRTWDGNRGRGGRDWGDRGWHRRGWDHNHGPHGWGR